MKYYINRLFFVAGTSAIIYGLYGKNITSAIVGAGFGVMIVAIFDII